VQTGFRLQVSTLMSAILQAPRPPAINRRRRVRQKVHAPAYATFTGASKNDMLDLYEILNISEVGVAVQAVSPIDVGQQIDLCLDLAESNEPIFARARVVWCDVSGRVGFGLPALPDSTLYRLRAWLFMNSMAAAADAAAASALASAESDLQPNFTDTLTAASAVQREAESLGADLEAVLALVALRSFSLLRASGAAIALTGEQVGTMVCRASAGPGAPPVGTILQVGSGFSGECVRSGQALRCDDSETDERVDRESCRALGIRSMLAAPVRRGEKIVGLLELFSAQPNAFAESQHAVLQRFAETIVAAINRAVPAAVPAAIPAAVPVEVKEERPAGRTPAEEPFVAPPGSILFAQAPEEKSDQKAAPPDTDKAAGIHLPRTYLYVLIAIAAVIFLALGFVSAPWIHPWIQQKLHLRQHTGQPAGEPKVVASSQPPAEKTKPTSPNSSSDAPTLAQLRESAQKGDAAAENALGLLYAQGDEKQSIQPDVAEAARWFTKAAEGGSVPAQYKLGLLYWGGHGVPKDANKAYFWAVLARAGGQEGSQDLAKVLANGMTRAQTAAIEQQADIWYRQHESSAKPTAGH
jgi:GAF domain/PilZ domain/Sel1 repeat